LPVRDLASVTRVREARRANPGREASRPLLEQAGTDIEVIGVADVPTRSS